MISLTYVSTAAPDLSGEQLRELLARWRPKNAAADLTGMLLYSDGNVIQALEGPPDSVESVFATIEADARHHGVIVLLRDEIEHREFPDWSMGFGRWDRTTADLEVEGVSGFLDERTQDPASGSALRLLEIFRDTVR